MKKFLTVLLASMLALSVCSCGKDTTKEQATSTAITQSAATTQPQQSTTATTEPVTASSASTENTVDWEDFLDEYEDWIDDYADFMKKFNANPQDPTLLQKSLTLAQEAAEWSEKAENLKTNLNSKDAIEYSNRLLKIIAKLS